MDDNNKVVLQNEDGEEQTFEHVMTLEVGDKTYVLLSEEGDDENVFPYFITKDEEGGDILEPVDDDEEFALICETYDNLDDDAFDDSDE